MRTARDWLLAEIETGRCLIPMPSEKEIIKGWSDQDLADMASNVPEWEFAVPIALNVPKKMNGYRVAHYIPPRDRLVLTAALIENYSCIHQAVTQSSSGVDFYRPLLQTPTSDYLRQDYHDHYQSFKDKILTNETAGYWAVHSDIENFAGSCTVNHLADTMEQAGFNEEGAELIFRAMDSWKNSIGYTGIPQGYAMTDILLKLYMAPIDKKMKETCPDVSYIRYVDDGVISAPTSDQAISAYVHYTNLLNERGLTTKESAFALVSPIKGEGDFGHGHAFGSEKVMQSTLLQAQQRGYVSQDAEWNEDNPDPDFLTKVYYSQVSPNGSTAPKNVRKYLFSYIMRHMVKANPAVLVDEMPQLMEAFPGRFEKLVRYAEKMNIAPNLMHMIAGRYFSADSLEDRNEDYQRLVLLDYFRRQKYPFTPDRIEDLYESVLVVARKNSLFIPENDYLKKLVSCNNIAPEAYSVRGWKPVDTRRYRVN